MSSENDELLPDFLAEAGDNLERVHSDLDRLLASKDRSALIDSISRGVHTVKGGSGMFGFKRMLDIAHSLETFLIGLKNDPSQIQESTVVFIQNEVQKLEALLKARDQLDVQKGTAPTGAPQREDQASPSPLATVTAIPTQAPAIDEVIRVPVGRINDIMNTIGETFLIRNQMVYLVENFRLGVQEPKDFFQAWDILDSSLRRSISELERGAMNMRMMSIQGLFSRMARVVQTYTSTSNKKILFQTHGEHTELDKKVLDALGDPLIHLIRNAMDHGIETAENRRAAGKAESGLIELSASIIGNEAVIEIKDNGKGMDHQKILASARNKGINVSHVTDEKSAIELIFLPGFSTAEKLSDVSGRGVGMDAVRSSVQALGGSINIDTRVGRGSTFTIKIPVSMSMIPVVLININGHKYAVPNRDILETRQTDFRQVRRNAGSDHIDFRGDVIPCIDIRQHIQATSKDHEEQIRECSIIFFQLNGRNLAARVSSLERTTEIISKALSPIAPKIPWVTGISVLPTGEPIFVISISQLGIEAMDARKEAPHVA